MTAFTASFEDDGDLAGPTLTRFSFLRADVCFLERHFISGIIFVRYSTDYGLTWTNERQTQHLIHPQRADHR